MVAVVKIEAGRPLLTPQADLRDSKAWTTQVTGVKLDQFLLALRRQMLLEQVLRVSPPNRPSAGAISRSFQRVAPITASA
jgi:hypothetical protein